MPPIRSVIVPACLISLAAGCSRGQGAAPGGPSPSTAIVRPPAVAGAFYDRQPFMLEAQVERALKRAKRSDVKAVLVGAVVPHAGYVFSGACAASVYALVRTGQYDRVIILAPSHHAHVSGISLPAPDLGAYQTPLGSVPIDREVCEALRGKPGFSTVGGADVREHAVEVQLPFLQKTAGTFKLVPLLCGSAGDDLVPRLAAALVPYLGPRTLLVASSDFTHYGPNYGFVPFDKDIPGHLRAWLGEAGKRVAALDTEGFSRHCRDTGDTICGAMPIRIVMAALAQSRPKPVGRVLDLATSGDVVGDYENSVSYAAIGFFNEAAEAGGTAEKPSTIGREPESGAGMNTNTQAGGQGTFSVSKEHQKQLLAIAREAIEAHLKTGAPKAFDIQDPALTTPAAVFVTLTQRGQLRGCIGTTEPRAALYRAVAELAVEAAVHDPRFAPLTVPELGRTHIEISVLSPMRRVKSAAEIEPKVHGVVVRRGFRSGLFLPQVWEHFADKEGFLDELCRQKAHLEPDAWKDPQTELLVFTVFAFEE
jgi:MEMO1 family protein